MLNDFNTIKFLTAIVTKEYTEYHSFARDRTVRENTRDRSRDETRIPKRMCTSTRVLFDKYSEWIAFSCEKHTWYATTSVYALLHS